MQKLLSTIFFALLVAILSSPNVGAGSPRCQCDGAGGCFNIYGECHPEVCRSIGCSVETQQPRLCLCERDRSEEQGTDDDPCADACPEGSRVFWVSRGLWYWQDSGQAFGQSSFVEEMVQDCKKTTCMNEWLPAEVGQVGTQWDGLGHPMSKVGGVPGWKDGSHLYNGFRLEGVGSPRGLQAVGNGHSAEIGFFAHGIIGSEARIYCDQNRWIACIVMDDELVSFHTGDRPSQFPQDWSQHNRPMSDSPGGFITCPPWPGGSGGTFSPEPAWDEIELTVTPRRE